MRWDEKHESIHFPSGATIIRHGRSRDDQHGAGGEAQQPLGDGAEHQGPHGPAPARAAHEQVELL